MKICDEKSCTGCSACENICQFDAITMKSDEKGFMHPLIDEKKCHYCGKCVQKCPSNNIDPSHLTLKSQSVFAAWTKNDFLRKESTSGGLFSLLAKEIIKQNGSVFGVRWTNEFKTEHCQIDSESVLWKIKKSKYVQSEIKGSYKDVERLLKDNRIVMFSGTPCQIAGLKAYLGREYDNLFTIDLICHGVPSYKIFSRYLNEISNNNINMISKIDLRFKKPGWSYASVRSEFKSGKIYQVLTVDDPYFCLFNFNYTLRDSCHNCPYACTGRQGDITLGDFWGFLPKSNKMSKFDAGVSCVLINSDKGKELFDCVSNKLFFEKRSLEEAVSANFSLIKPFAEPFDLAEFWDDYLCGDSIESLAEKYIKQKYKIPKYYHLRRLYHEYNWLKYLH